MQNGRRMAGDGAIVRVAEIEPVMKKTPSDVLLILCDCHTQFANLMGLSLMTDDGEASEGAALEGGGAWQSDVLHQPRAG